MGAALKFENDVISSHTLMAMLLLTHAGIKHAVAGWVN